MLLVRDMNTTRPTMMTAAIALLSACGAGVALEPHAPTLGSGLVCFGADGGGQCPQDLPWAEGEAQHLLVVAGLLDPGAHLPARVEVQSVDIWVEWGAEVLGVAPIGVIKVGPHLTVLVHEALHIVDFARGSVGTIAHEAWRTNGHYALAGIFAYRLYQHTGVEWNRLTVAGSPDTKWEHAYSWSDSLVVCGPTAGMPVEMLERLRGDAPTWQALTELREHICTQPVAAL